MSLHIVLSSDQNYLPFLGVTIVSILENNREFKEITIHILATEIASIEQKKLIDFVESQNRKCIIYDLSNIAERLGDLKVETFALSAYSRLFISEILPEDIDKVLYLDCDSLVLKSFKELWNIDLKNFIVAGVEDMVDVQNKIAINIPESARYINSGMMLLNIKRIRDEKWMLKIKEFMMEFNGEIPYADQGVINAMFYNNALILHPKYNCMTPFFLMNSNELQLLYKLDFYYSDKELSEAIEEPIFIHFTESFVTRPWVKKSKHPLAKKYLQYLMMTPWRDFEVYDDKRILNVKLASFLFYFVCFGMFISIFKALRKIKQYC